MRPEFLGDSFRLFLEVFDLLEGNATYVNLSPKGEPQLGKRGLYRSVGGGSSQEAALLWVLSLSDLRGTTCWRSWRSGLHFAAVREAADWLLDADLLAPA